MKHDLAADVGAAAVKASPALGMSVASAAGWTEHLGGAQLVVYALTAGFIALQISYLIWKWRREARKPE